MRIADSPGNFKFSARRAQKRAPTPAIPAERLRYLARRIHRLGPRPLYELLRELQAGAPLHECVEAYARLDGDFIRALGGDRLPAVSLAARRKGSAP